MILDKDSLTFSVEFHVYVLQTSTIGCMVNHKSSTHILVQKWQKCLSAVKTNVDTCAFVLKEENVCTRVLSNSRIIMQMMEFT